MLAGPICWAPAAGLEHVAETQPVTAAKSTLRFPLPGKQSPIQQLNLSSIWTSCESTMHRLWSHALSWTPRQVEFESRYPGGLLVAVNLQLAHRFAIPRVPHFAGLGHMIGSSSVAQAGWSRRYGPEAWRTSLQKNVSSPGSMHGSRASAWYAMPCDKNS